MSRTVAIAPPPSLRMLAEYHPQVALAVAMGANLRPNLRPLSVQLTNAQVGQPQTVSFAEVISQYSIFAGVDVTVDPTNNEPGNPVKPIADAAQALVTGVTLTLLVKGAGGTDYTPIPEETPVQSLPDLLAPHIGVWRMVNPENVKARFILQSPADGTPQTLWLVFGFYVPSSDADVYLSQAPDDARKKLMATTAWQMATMRGQ